MNKSLVVNRLVVKVGTTTLTTAAGGVDKEYITRLASELAELRQLGKDVVLVSSGAIKSGLERLGMKKAPKTMPELQAAAAIGQGLLMQEYSECFAGFGQAVAQILLTREDMTDRRRYLNARNTFFKLFEYQVIPIVNENDTVATEEIKFGDNDLLAALVAELVEADLLINLSDVEGFYLEDPKRVANAQLIPVVEEITAEIEESAQAAVGGAGTGGMVAKVQAAKIACSSGVPMVIAHGRRGGVIFDIIEGKRVGSWFMPKETKISSRKRWIAFGAALKGVLVVNEGAKRMIVEAGKSLLPVGVVEVSGDFGIGDSVSIKDEKRVEFARGLVNYSSSEIELIKGLKTSQIEGKLGYKDFDEVVHRDNLVLL